NSTDLLLCASLVFSRPFTRHSSFLYLFPFPPPPPPEFYTLSLHDALPISSTPRLRPDIRRKQRTPGQPYPQHRRPHPLRNRLARSEEHTSELQSRFDLVCRLLLEKKKRKKSYHCSIRSSNTRNK